MLYGLYDIILIYKKSYLVFKVKIKKSFGVDRVGVEREEMKEERRGSKNETEEGSREGEGTELHTDPS